MTLQPSRLDIGPYHDRLWPAYKEYCTTVSPRGMAISIETAAYLWWLCDHEEATRVVDLGSGFTSYVLREYAAHAGRDVIVMSVDDNESWLDKTGMFLHSVGHSADGLYLADEWRNTTGRFDVIIHDFSSGAIREEWMTVAADRLEDGGVIIFDDAQHPEHYRHMCEVARSHSLYLLDVYEQTVDEIRRFAAVAA